MMSQNPEIAEAFALYMQCRSQQLFYMETVKGSGKNQTTIKRVVPFTQGYGILPYEGGLLDQPYRTMEFFEIFLNIDREHTNKTLSK